MYRGRKVVRRTMVYVIVFVSVSTAGTIGDGFFIEA